MSVNTTRRKQFTQSKFCANCGHMIRDVATPADIAVMEACCDCKPYYAAIAAAHQQLLLETAAISDARVCLERIRTDRRVAIIHCTTHN